MRNCTQTRAHTHTHTHTHTQNKVLLVELKELQAGGEPDLVPKTGGPRLGAGPPDRVCCWCVCGVWLVCVWCVADVCVVCCWCVGGVLLVCVWCVAGMCVV